MKRNPFACIFLIALLMLSCNNNGRKNETKNGTIQTGQAELVFNEYEHHFGEVTEGEKISWQFIFKNTGTSDLVLNSVTTTCGCTVPRYDKKPIAPGEEGRLEVIFDTSGRNGVQTKTVTVKSNAIKPVQLLKITAEVIPNKSNN